MQRISLPPNPDDARFYIPFLKFKRLPGNKNFFCFTPNDAKIISYLGWCTGKLITNDRRNYKPKSAGTNLGEKRTAGCGKFFIKYSSIDRSVRINANEMHRDHRLNSPDSLFLIQDILVYTKISVPSAAKNLKTEN